MVKIKVRPRFVSRKSALGGTRSQSNKCNKNQLNVSNNKDKSETSSTSLMSSETLGVPTQSLNDAKRYRVIKLENGLIALLISDSTPVDDSEEESDEEESDEDDFSSEEESGSESDENDASASEDNHGNKDIENRGHKLAAASLSIGVGSFHDPDDIPGLSHFLEHMVFMGSEKYPEENSFEAFITRRGGFSNAFTDCERTNFHFEVHKKHLFETLNRFAQFFISPLLKKCSIDREIEAVDSEFQSSVQSDDSRKDQLLGSFSVSGHPMGKFMWGNFDTLKTVPLANGIDVYSRLAEFRKRYYLSNKMTLAIQSQEELDTLEKWVKEIFCHVQPGNFESNEFAHLDKPFNTPEFRKLYKIVSVGSSNLLILTWSFPSMAQYYKEKPLDYIYFLIGHEGKGSLLSYLKRNVWALNLWTEDCSNGFQRNSTNNIFSFTVELTDNGMDHLHEVLTAIFSYIKMLKHIGPQKRIYDEIQLVAFNSFRWIEEVPAIEYVEKLAESMQMYPVIDYITGEEFYFQYDEALIKECLGALNPEDVNIMVLSKNHVTDDIKEREPWYQTLYKANDISLEWMKQWNDVEPLADFFIPTPNHFIATDFNLKLEDVNKSDIPIKILENEKGCLWYKQDLKFKVPKAIIRCHLLSPIIDASPLNALLVDLFIMALDQNLREDVYPASVAMLEYRVVASNRGLTIDSSGFNHKLMALFETIVDHIVHFNISDALFEAVKTNIGKQYYNTCIKPNKLTNITQCSIIRHTYWSPLEKMKLLDDVSKDLLLQFISDFKSRLYVECLCQGNISSTEAVDIFNLAKTKFESNDVKLEELLKNRTMKILEGQNYCRVAGLNLKDGKSVVNNYYQYGPANIHSSCLMELLIQFMEEPCFDYLRTKEQLGYNVYCQNYLTFGISGFGVIVHSSADKFSCSAVDEKIEEFLNYFRKYLNDITEEDFQIQVSSLIKSKQQPDLYLKEEVDRNSWEIQTGNYVFDRLEREVLCLQNITLKDFREWFSIGKTDCLAFNKLSVQVMGNENCKNIEENSIDNNESKTCLNLKFLEINEYNNSSRSHFIMDISNFKKDLEIFQHVYITS